MAAPPYWYKYSDILMVSYLLLIALKGACRQPGERTQYSNKLRRQSILSAKPRGLVSLATVKKEEISFRNSAPKYYNKCPCCTRRMAVQL